MIYKCAAVRKRNRAFPLGESAYFWLRKKMRFNRKGRKESKGNT